MIGKLSGSIETVAEKHVLLDVQGVGYVVHTSRKTLGRLGRAGEAASLYIETQVREDSITLYGFTDATEQAWFNLLCSVQGVGAKVGLAILSVSDPARLAMALAAQDKTVFTQADGVGPKLGTRIVTELKDKAAKMAVPVSTAGSRGGVKNAAVAPCEKGTPIVVDEAAIDTALFDDALSALENLGYARGDSYGVLMRVQAEASGDLQALIRLSLKELSPV